MTHSTAGTLATPGPQVERPTSQPPPQRPPAGGPIVHLALVGAGATDPAITAAIVGDASWCELIPLAIDRLDDPRTLRQVDCVLLIDRPGNDEADAEEVLRYDQLLTFLRSHRVGAAVITPRPWVYAGYVSGVVCIPLDSPTDLIRGVCMSLAHLRPVLRQLDIELASMEQMGKQLAKHFEEVNQELRLAARLQHDFLPREMPQVDGLRFTTMFRPCSWVSGDTFDVFPLDHEHVGLYVADAVGHGVAAGLLTMLIKNAIQMSRVAGEAVRLIPPGDVLARLNDALAAQALPDSQFITAWYGVINTRTLRMRYASGGHPPPIRVAADGTTSEVKGDGCLLGIFPSQSFAEREVQLAPGERVMVFSDGLENVLLAPITGEGEPRILAADISPESRRPPGEFIEFLTHRLDREPGGLSRADDVTMILVDTLGPAGHPG